MTPVAQYILLGLIGLLVIMLIARIVRRWWASRRAARIEPAYQPAPRPTVPAEASAAIQPPQPPATPSSKAAPVSGLPAMSILRTSATVGDSAPTSSANGSIHPQSSRLFGPAIKTDTAQKRYESDEMPFADRSDYSFGSATPLLAAMLPEGDEKRQVLKRQLKNAGYYTPHAWQNLAAVRYLGLIVPILLFGTLLILVPASLEMAVIGCLVVFAILGYALPGLLVQSQAASRIREIEQGMPDMLDMLNMCVSQGMTLPNSLHRVGVELRSVYPDLAKELAIVSDQSRIAGLPTALQSFADRVDNPDVHSFTSLLMQTEQMGTSVSDALSGYAENMREGLKQRADMKGNSATFKLLFPTVFCLMPAVFLFLLGPAIVQLHDFYRGGGTDLLRQNADSVLTSQE